MLARIKGVCSHSSRKRCGVLRYPLDTFCARGGGGLYASAGGERA